MLRHALEPTTSTAATSGRPSGLHPTATMVAPFDPGVRAARVGGFIFGGWDSHSRTLQVQAEKAGISLIAGVLMGKILVFLHFPQWNGSTPILTQRESGDPTRPHGLCSALSLCHGPPSLR